MLGQRHRQCPNIQPALVQRLVLAGSCVWLIPPPPPPSLSVWRNEWMNEWVGFCAQRLIRPYRLNWARRTSWGWWDEWHDAALQTQDSKFEPWWSEAEHASLPLRDGGSQQYWIHTSERRRNNFHFVSFTFEIWRSKWGSNPRSFYFSSRQLLTLHHCQVPRLYPVTGLECVGQKQSNLEMFTRCRINVVPASQTVAQHWYDIAWTSRVEVTSCIHRTHLSV